jgi:hypothetical protein
MPVIVEIDSEDKLIADICSSYWAIGDDGQFLQPVAEITKHYKLNSASLLKIVSTYSAARSENQACTGCGTWYRFKNRSDFRNFAPGSHWTCGACVESAQATREQQLRDHLRQERDLRAANVWRASDLGFRELVYLLSIIRHSASEDLSHIAPYTNGQLVPLSPDTGFDTEILTVLRQSGLIYVHPESNLNAFELLDDSPYRYYTTRVAWGLPLPQEAEQPRELVELLERLVSCGDVLNARRDELLALAKEISLLECLSFLGHVLAEHRLTLTPSDKTKIVLSRALEVCSVSQVYNLIWSATRAAAAFCMRGANRRHAANSVVGNIQRHLDRALANNWTIGAFRRNFSLPQSILSQVVFNTCLGTDDGGFTQPLWKLIPGTSEPGLQEEPTGN